MKIQPQNLPSSRSRGSACFVLIGAIFLFSIATSASFAQEEGAKEEKELIKQLQEMAPMLGYLEAHRGVREPFSVLGGPITVTVRQASGGVHVALPDHRNLDKRVFGTPKMPRHFAGSPIVTGLPPKLRGVEDGSYTKATKPSPFGDKHVVMGNGKMSLHAVDATATDAARSDDSVTFKASWEDGEGNSYKVTCDEVLPHGVEYPTFGGVVTNHILHGVSSVGSPLMPTGCAYVAFWGIGDVHKNGQVVDSGRIVHGMLTEYMRKEGYELAFDHEVTPTRRHFHLMVAPVEPKDGHFAEAPVKTGMMLPNGKELPFWHVMFANLEIESDRNP